jgi:hypothetical protein
VVGQWIVQPSKRRNCTGPLLDPVGAVVALPLCPCKNNSFLPTATTGLTAANRPARAPRDSLAATVIYLLESSRSYYGPGSRRRASPLPRRRCGPVVRAADDWRPPWPYSKMKPTDGASGASAGGGGRCCGTAGEEEEEEKRCRSMQSSSCVTSIVFGVTLY